MFLFLSLENGLQSPTGQWGVSLLTLHACACARHVHGRCCPLLLSAETRAFHTVKRSPPRSHS